MDTLVKVYGETRRTLSEDWQKIICFVAYSDAEDHRKITEESFQYHLNLDVEYMKQNNPDHFWAPHNVARAILLYHYFREKHLFFADNSWECIAGNELPNRDPDAEDESFRLWITAENKL